MAIRFNRSPNRNEYLAGWKYGAFVAAALGFTVLFLFPIIVDPMLNVDKYKRLQEVTQKELAESGFDPRNQPGALKEWSDPFHRSSKMDSK